MHTFCESVTMLKCNINSIVYFNHKSDFVQKGFKGFSNIINQRVPYVKICITFCICIRESIKWLAYDYSMSDLVRRVSRYA